MSDSASPSIEKPVAFVIGASGAIGESIALGLADANVHVVGGGRRGADSTQSQVEQWIPIDVTDDQHVAKAFAELRDRFGRLDLLVNAAGAPTKMNLLLRMTPADWEQQHAVHSRGAFLTSQQAAKVMRKQRQGRIVNVASVAAAAPVVPGYSAYAAAKSAMTSLTRCLNQEMNQYGVQATAVCPTYVNSPAWEQSGMDGSQMLQTKDVADAVVFLSKLPPRVRIETIDLETAFTGRDRSAP